MRHGNGIEDTRTCPTRSFGLGNGTADWQVTLARYRVLGANDIVVLEWQTPVNPSNILMPGHDREDPTGMEEGGQTVVFEITAVRDGTTKVGAGSIGSDRGVADVTIHMANDSSGGSWTWQAEGHDGDGNIIYAGPGVAV